MPKPGTYNIVDWWRWVSFCEAAKIDPWENADVSFCRSNGDGSDMVTFKYIGEYPKRD